MQNPTGMNLSVDHWTAAPSSPSRPAALESGSGRDAAGVRRGPSLVEGTSRPTFRYDGLSRSRQSVTSTVTLEVKFLAGSWEDARGAQGAAETENFRLQKTTADDPFVFDLGNPQPVVYLASPFNGVAISVDQINAKGYVDITFLAETGKRLVGINGDEIRIRNVGGALNLDPAQNGNGGVFTVVKISNTTYRYFIAAKPATGTNPNVTATTQTIAPANPAFVAGEVVIEFIAGTWGNENADGSGRVVFGAATLFGEGSDPAAIQSSANQKVVFAQIFTVTAAAMASSVPDSALRVGPVY